MHTKIREGWGTERRMRIPEKQRRDSQGPVAVTPSQKRACETGVKPHIYLYGEGKKTAFILPSSVDGLQVPILDSKILFSSVQLPSRFQLFATPWTTARQASLSITNSWNVLKPISIESVMPSNHLILCHPLLLLPSIFPSIRVFSSESALHIRWPSASVLPMNTQEFLGRRKTRESTYGAGS